MIIADNLEGGFFFGMLFVTSSWGMGCRMYGQSEGGKAAPGRAF
jgi:hypothetical protein